MRAHGSEVEIATSGRLHLAMPSHQSRGLPLQHGLHPHVPKACKMPNAINLIRLPRRHMTAFIRARTNKPSLGDRAEDDPNADGALGGLGGGGKPSTKWF